MLTLNLKIHEIFHLHDIYIFFFFFRYNDARGEGGGSLRPRMSVLRMATAEKQISSKVTKLVGKRNMMMRE